LPVLVRVLPVRPGVRSGVRRALLRKSRAPTPFIHLLKGKKRMEEQATTLGKKEFADYLGKAPSYVTKLKADGRLVMTPDGKKVDVAASLRLIEQTTGSRVDVSDRWKAARASRTPAAEGNDAGNAEKTPQRPMAQADAADKIGSSLQAARAVKEKYAAMTAKVEYEKLIGELENRDDVHADLRSIGSILRSAMDVFPDQTAPLVVATSDLHEIHRILTENCNWVLHLVAAEIMKLRHLEPDSPGENK
jgi:hypothetical protein